VFERGSEYAYHRQALGSFAGFFDLGFGRALPSCVKNTVKAFLIAMCQPPIGALQVVQCINDFSLNGLQ